MSADEPEPADAEAAGEERQMSEGTAKAILAIVVVASLAGIIVAFPCVAYFVAGALSCWGWQRVASWIEARGEDVEGDAEEEPDVVEALEYLGRNGNHVLLTQLQRRLGVKDTKAVRKLLKAEKIRVRPGVRTPAGNGPGVHQEDIPAPPPVEATPSEGGCSCRPEPTTPTPTTGTTVEAIGLAGVVVKDGSETSRQHRVR